jgi:hypothetical protein
MALTPTLTLWHVEGRNESPEEFEKGMNTVVLPQLRAYSEAGGQILFGTDVGYFPLRGAIRAYPVPLE